MPRIEGRRPRHASSCEVIAFDAIYQDQEHRAAHPEAGDARGAPEPGTLAWAGVEASTTRADWSDAFALVPSLEVGYVWHASRFTREVLDGLLRNGFVHHQQIISDKQRTVLTRTHDWFL